MTRLSCLFASLALLVSCSAAFACTVLESPFPGDTRYAHNVDWYSRFPDVMGIVTLNPAYLEKDAELYGAPVPPAHWVSQYRSFTFSIAGVEFPVSGFNEKGLSMAILELAGTTYPPDNDPRPALNASQFVQYNLDRSASLDDVMASGKEFRPFSRMVQMHYFVCEAGGKCAVIQYIGGELKVYRDGDLPFPILTNSRYPESAAAAASCISDLRACSLADNSLSRFANAARLRSELKSPDSFVQDAFGLLTSVAQTGPGNFTRFQLVLDPVLQAVKFRKGITSKIGELKVSFADADCRQPRKILPVDENTVNDPASSWIELTPAFQTDMAVKMGYPEKIAEVFGQYPFKVKCVAPAPSR